MWHAPGRTSCPMPGIRLDLVLVQRVALERARARGLDPDNPRSLTRSVMLQEPAVP